MSHVESASFDFLFQRLLAQQREAESETHRVLVQTRSELYTLRRREWDRLAGPVADKMLQDLNLCTKQLNGSDSNLRYVALSILVNHWKLGATYHDAIVRMIDNDSSPDVRAAAIASAVESSEENVSRREIAKVLSRVFRNSLEDERVRRTAYSFLLYLAGRDHEIRPSTEGFNFTAVDEGLIRSAEQGTLKRLESDYPRDRLAEVGKLTLDDIQSGLESYGRGEYEDVIGCFTRLIQSNPSSTLLYCMRGCGFAKLGKTEQAIDDFSSAIRLNSENAMAHFLRGLALAQKGMADLARADFNNATALDPTLPLPYGTPGE